jgi:hypothetical protein
MWQSREFVNGNSVSVPDLKFSWWWPEDFWYVTPCILVDRYQHFWSTWYLHLKGSSRLLKNVGTYLSNFSDTSHNTTICHVSITQQSIKNCAVTGFWNIKIKVKLSLKQAVEVHRVVNVKAPTFCRQMPHRRQWRCQFYVPATLALYPEEDPWYSFLLEAQSTPRP